MSHEQMTSRQRIKAAIRYQPVDRLPVQESPWEEVPDMWAKQGMPVDTAAGATSAAAVADYFGFDMIGMSLDASPRFEQKIIERSGGYITYEDRFGYTAKKPDGRSGTKLPCSSRIYPKRNSGGSPIDLQATRTPT